MGPISTASAADAPAQMVEAYNIGDGQLALQVSSNAPWLSGYLGEAANCTLRAGLCTPINIALSTASLAKGRYTGLLTVADPNAVDAPQTISVTVQVGGSVPDSIDFHVAPGGSQEYVIQANNLLGIIPSTETGGSWLSLLSEGGGSFRFNFNYRILARHLEGMADGQYAGKLNVFNSVVNEENKQVPVTLTVTSGPILVVPERLMPRLAAGGPAMTGLLALGNRGGGDLQASSVTWTTATGGDWLAAELVSDGRAVAYAVNQAGLEPGLYNGVLEITSNASKSVQQIPITLDVMAAESPMVAPASVLDITTLEAGAALAPGSLARLQGTQLSAQPKAINEGVPLPDTLGGVRVLINGLPSALFSVAQDEILFQLPYGIEAGEALLQVERDGQLGNQVELTIIPQAPRVELAGSGTYAKAMFDDGSLALPSSLGGRPAMAGETLNVAVTGLGRTEPGTATGQAPDPANLVAAPVRVSFGSNLFSEGVVTDAVSAGLIPGLPGHYKVKVTVPEGVTPGDSVNLIVFAGGVASNKVQIAIQ
ncbi:hypothetical protein [Paludibaculum fermentans]|uniref:BACON domain-containing protein n=1 Tax=Paludibaculum fermentans TaxID=1473598 RepID=A0A7S7NNX3_PALFE|nr:hypothetical protein [Paludibaculum fermentans]QOY87034.1 hypothetical protein IRI77_30345 [Paludibaculum fermentans]